MPERSSDDSKQHTIVEERDDATPTELGDAVEEYLERAERLGKAPELESFVAEFSHCGEELRSALEGLAMLNGLLGSGGESRTGKSGMELRLPVPSFEPGNSLAGYRIVRELGRGGMGVVYEAVHVDLDRPVALKVLRDWSGGSARRRFLNEAKTAASLHHTNIVPVFDVGQTENTTYYAMQKIEGEGLDRIIRQRRTGSPRSQTVEDSRSQPPDSPNSTAVILTVIPDDSLRSARTPGSTVALPSRQFDSKADKVSGSASSQVGTGSFARWVAGVGYQAAMALDYAHKRQVVHRDIKPSNLILDKTGTIWVTDFGLALRLDDPGISRGDGVLGTPRYTSPEQAARKVVDYRTDIYSLGVTLYELLTGKPAYDGESSDEVIRKILTEAPVSPRVLDSSISRDLETIILKAMSSRPEDRYATAGELADDLDRFLRYEPVRARRIGPVGRFSRLVRRHPAVSMVTAVAASIVFGVATFAYRQVARERDDALLARSETLIALSGEKTALEKAKAAMRKQLWREASLTRMSAVPNRRRTILELVAEAATYDPEPELRSKLRNEVVEALSMSDVKATPPLTYDPVAGFEMMGDQRRTVTISEDNRRVDVWDIETRSKRAEILLDELFRESGSARQRPLPETTAGSGAGGPPGSRGSRDGPFGSVRRFLRAIFTVGDTVGVVRPDGRGVLWIDAETAEPRGEWSCPNEGVLVDVQAIGNEPRILTIEYHSKGYMNPASPAVIAPGLPNPDDELVILIHDLNARDEEPLILDRFKFEPERGRFLPSVLSLSTDGAWVALCRFFEDTVRVVDTRTGKELGSIAAQVPVTSVAAGPQRLLAVAGGGTIRLWRYEVKQDNGSPVLSTKALPSIGTNLGVVEKIRFAPEGNLIAAAGKASGIELWEIESGQTVATLGTGGPVMHMAFAANGSKMLASTAEKRNGSVRIWTIEKPLVRSFVGSSPETVEGLVSLGEGAQESLLVRSLSGKVRFRTARDNGLREIPLMSEMSRVSSLRTDDSARLWVMTERSVLRYDNWTAQAPTLLNPSVTFPLGEFSRGGWPNRGINGGLILAPGSDRVFTLSGPFLQMMDPAISPNFHPVDLSMNWNSQTSNDTERNGRDRRDGPGPEPRNFDGRQGQGRMRQLPSRPSEPMSAFSFFRGPTPVTRKLSVLPGGSDFAILRGSNWEYCEIGNLETTPEGKVWSVNRRPPPVGAPVSDIVVVAISPDKRTLALGQRSGVVTLIDLITWRTMREIRPEESEDEAQNEVVDLKFMPNDPSFLAIVRQKKISVWCLRLDPAHFLDLPVDLNPTSPVIWNGSGSGLYVVENDGNVYFWDVRRILETIEGMKLR